jgi:hypothetical protein
MEWLLVEELFGELIKDEAVLAAEAGNPLAAISTASHSQRG